LVAHRSSGEGVNEGRSIEGGGIIYYYYYYYYYCYYYYFHYYYHYYFYLAGLEASNELVFLLH